MSRRLLSLMSVLVATATLLAPAAAQGAIPVGRAPYAMLANPAAHEIYVANIFSDNVSVIDANTDSVTTTISVGRAGTISAPAALAHNPATGKLYCVNYWAGKLVVISLPSKTIETSIPVGYSHANPRAVVVNPATNLVYVTNITQGLVYVVDGEPASPTYNTVRTTIPVGFYPRSAAVNATLSRLYIANTSSNSVSVIDIDPLSASCNQVIATIPTGVQPYALTLNHATGKVYVANRSSNSVNVIDGVTNSVLATIAVGSHPRAVEVNPDRDLVYVANRDSNTVSVIDGASDALTRTVTVGTTPYALAGIRTLTGDTYVANYHDSSTTGTVTTIDAAFGTSETAVGRGPSSLAIDTLFAKPKVYVGNYNSNDVSVIDPDFGASSLLTTIDPLPGDGTDDPTPVLTGSSTSLVQPFPGRIMSVYWRLDGHDSWSEARIVEGDGTPSARWEVALEESLAAGEHTLQVCAMDMTGATLVSSDGFASSSAHTGAIASYTFTYPRPSDEREDGWVFGRVTDEYTGRPYRGLLVELKQAGRAARTDARGYYRFNTVPPNGSGEFPAPAYIVRLVLRKPLASHEPLSKTVTVIEGSGARVDWSAHMRGRPARRPASARPPAGRV
ncbi:MAG: hypothetical protein C4521_02420 [Actinobacteria bacterium]|nr:MAG: hypothetical protein C4521_02420 [Actinomycetota bacterium]